MILQLGGKLVEYQERFETMDGEDIEEKETLTKQEVASALSGMISQNHNLSISHSATDRYLSFEVDFEVFKLRFWPTVAPSTKLDPLTVWSEIYSVLKGHEDAVKYNDYFLPLNEYLEILEHKSSALTLSERYQVYMLFLKYEKWRQRMKAYDMMDLTNHILKQVKMGALLEQTKFHFLMVDEVQDLTPNIILLMVKLVSSNVFFCGDTAQTIAKGVNFRFYDLKRIFAQQNDLTIPNVVQLTKNFRTHGRVLDLANSLVALIELFFPTSIDRLKREMSDQEGPKPIVIEPCKEHTLRELLFGRTMTTQLLQEGSSSQFGCN